MLLFKSSPLYRGETESQATSCKVYSEKQTKTNKKKNKYIHTHTHKYACWFVCLYVERDRIRVRQPAVSCTQKSKQTNMHTCVSVYVYVYAERERISVTLVTTAAQACPSDLCMCTHERVCWYYFANLSTVSVWLPVHTVTQKHTHTELHCFYEERERIRVKTPAVR